MHVLSGVRMDRLTFYLGQKKGEGHYSLQGGFGTEQEIKVLFCSNR